MTTGAGRLALLTAVHTLCLIIFSRGFLLSRIELPNVSACQPQSWAGPQSNSVSGCWSDVKFKKVVLLLVDAMRFDFVLAERDPTAPHVEKLPKLLSLLQDSGDAALLMKLKADPPTNTVQRLKAMLTGSLPTFMDVGTVFSAAAITEDNLLAQLKARGAKLGFVGDDTWEQLFPGFFDISIPYPSFDIFDLHTVDDGVWKHIPDLTMNSTDKWDFIIGHYLGVDHAGHAYGVQTPEMMEKLSQMDTQITSIVNMLIDAAGPKQQHSNTLVLVLGDHGQTLHGDHGGGTWEETESPLLAFDIGSIYNLRHRGAKLFREGALQRDLGFYSGKPTCAPISEIDQLDLASNMAMILGVPIPFGNVGSISEIFWRFVHGDDKQTLVEALRRNSLQVNNYLTLYAAKVGNGLKSLDRLHTLYNSIVPGAECSKHKYLDYLIQVASFAREQWTQFNFVWMGLGIALLVAALAYQVYIIMAYSSLETGSEKLLWVICFCHGVSMLSNSYIMAEGRMFAFWISTITIFMMYDSLSYHRCSQAPVSSQPKDMFLSHKSGSRVKGAFAVMSRQVQFVGCGLCFLILTLALEKVGLADRTGTNPFDKTGLGPVTLDTSKFLQQCLTHVPLVVMPSILTFSYVSGSLLDAHNASVKFFSFAGCFLMWAEFLLVSGWRFIQDFDTGKSLSLPSILPFSLPEYMMWSESAWMLPFHVLLPRVVYCLAIIAIVVLAAYFLFCGSIESEAGRVARRDIQERVIGCLLPVVVVLLGRGGPLQCGIAVVRIACFLKMLRFKDQSPNFIAGIVWMLSKHIFFGTGHYCEFTGLRFVASFTGLDEFNIIHSGALLAIDTFGAYVLGVFVLPLAANTMEPIAGDFKRPILQASNEREYTSSMQGMLLMFVTIQAFMTLVATIGATIHRRHLLVWAIFAPKFVFSAFFLLITDVVILPMAMGRGS